ncbi:MAG: acyl-CoA dehydrogenase [Geminicoccaceae bacterium]|nr:acyl-CoA dehydrogenase [Geminicoccaceae bacterium]
MTPYVPPLDDIRFVLDRIAGPVALDGETVGAVLAEAGRFAAGVLAPLNAVGDREGCRLENGAVRTPRGFKEAYALLVEGGWPGLPFPEEAGGQGLPWALNAAVGELWNAANMAFTLCPLLTQGAVEAVLHHASDDLKAVYLEKLVSGAWTAAMCLTEPGAGSDVGALRTGAERDGEGRWRIRGQKVFITFGDHDMAPNVVHLVLARTPGAPQGTRGISLFLVPKFVPDAGGGLGARNDLRCLKLEHKLGIHGSPTCVVQYGDDAGALGFLVGREHGGMAAMFTMMNNARLGVGLEGLGVAERAYQGALAYARERVQGRTGGRPATLLDHADVRRMLLTMRARIAAMRALCLWASASADAAAKGDGEAAGRVALLTPIVKAWCTDLGCEVASLGVQVHGGMGYVEETGAAQPYRDARIAPIYEGTNGIQALDLATRKLGMANGALPAALFAALEGWLPGLPEPLREGLKAGLADARRATERLRADPDAPPAAATPYLRLMGGVVGAFLVARGAASASDTEGRDWPALARFTVNQLLPLDRAHLAAVLAEPGDLAVEAFAPDMPG